ncbi:MAG: acyl carrier protein [Planctomycetes bacterium]|nr:acyl carrier protein [Planctomycetota bacterium]
MTTKKQRRDVIAGLVVDKFRIDRSKVRPTSRLIDFGIDSVQALELIVELERVFDVSIPDQDLTELETLEDIARYVERRKRAG